MRAADVDAFETAGALPRIDHRGEQAARARSRAFGGVEERPGLGDGESDERVRQLLQIAAQDCAVDRQTFRRSGDDFVEGLGRLVAPIDLARRVGERMDEIAQRLALRLGDVELTNRGEQQVVDVVHGVGDRRVGAGERAFHAAGAQVRQEFRRLEPEQALVLAGGAAGRQEHAGARHHWRFGD